MTKTKFSDYNAVQNGNRTIDEAISEIDREMQVRRRLFDRWVMEGRMSWVDAHDRIERHMTALRYLIKYSQIISEELDKKNNAPDVTERDDSGFELDEVPAQQAA